MNPPFPAPPSKSVWSREPYRLFFPLGVLLAQVGVVHWLIYAAGGTSAWRSFFHAITLVQGFLLCFALGFLYTFIPRRTGTLGPSLPRLGVSLLLPVLTTASAWLEAWKLSQLFFLAQLVVLLSFVLKRVLKPGEGRGVPEGMLWVPLAISLGAVGALLTVVPLGEARWLHGLGTNMLLQGMFTGLVMGVGGMLLPMLLHGQQPPIATGRERRLKQALHLAAALLFVASFIVELRVSSSAGHALRAAVATGALVVPVALWHPPAQPGLHRWLVWGSAWMLPLGYLVVALRPEFRTAGLHVVFLGCFAMMSLAISVHVVLSHGGYGELLKRYTWQVGTVGGLMLVAMTSRLLMSFAPQHMLLWLGGAASAFLAATLIWGAYVLPRTRGAASHSH